MLSPAILELLLSGALLGALYIVVSIGISLIFGVMRVMNFAHGEVVMLGMYGAYWAHESGGVDPYAAGLVIVPVVFLMCLTVLRGFVLWLVRSPPLVQVFATLGLSIALQNLRWCCGAATTARCRCRTAAPWCRPAGCGSR